jgi:hypothetical protein
MNVPAPHAQTKDQGSLGSLSPTTLERERTTPATRGAGVEGGGGRAVRDLKVTLRVKGLALNFQRSTKKEAYGHLYHSQALSNGYLAIIQL